MSVVDKNTKAQSGFTLAELVIVIALLSVLLTLVFGTMGNIVRARNVVDGEREASRSAQKVLRTLDLELSGMSTRIFLYKPKDTNQGLTPQDPEYKPEEILDTNDDTKGETDADSVKFITSHGGQAIYNANPNFGYVEVSYHLADLPAELKEKYRDSRVTPYALVRTEIPAKVNNDELVKQRKIVSPLATNVVAFNLRYYYEEEWENEVPENSKGKLPAMVEVAISFLGSNDDVDTYKTIVSVPSGFTSFKKQGF